MSEHPGAAASRHRERPEQKMLAVSQAAQRAAEAAEGGEGDQSDREIAALRHALALSLDALGLPSPRPDYP